MKQGIIGHLQSLKLGDRLFLIRGKRKISYAEFLADTARETLRFEGDVERQIALGIENVYDCLVLFFALEHLGKRVALINQQLAGVEVQNFLNRTGSWSRFNFREPAETDAAAALPAYKPGEAVLMTSGTTGRPKGAVHTLESLSRFVKVPAGGQAGVWLLTYNFYTFAGLQILLHAMMSGGTVVMPEPTALDAVKNNAVTHISGTPSFWRLLLAQAGEDDKKYFAGLKQITLGGETVPQELLDRLSAAFPQASLTHIYASTEMGACFVVKDKKAGLPEEVLTEAGEVRARIVDGELQLQSPSSMKKYLDAPERQEGWFATGDLVRQENKRIYFTGRRSTIINVGGSKVYPYEVEEILYQVPGVMMARVSGEKSSLMGEIVKAEIDIEPGYSEKSVRAAIEEHAAKRLAPFQRPRIVQVAKHSLVYGDKISRRIE